MTTENPDVLHFVLDLYGRPLYEPEAFDPASVVGQAYALKVAAEAAVALADTDLTAAAAELRELEGFVGSATTATNVRKYGEARDRADLLARNLPALQRARDDALLRLDQVASTFNNQYGGYTAAITSWNQIVAQGLDWHENPGYYFSQWAQEVKVLPDRIAQYEAQLRQEVPSE